MFFGALPPLIELLCVLPRPFPSGPFSRDFVLYWETTSSPSNIPFVIKLRSRQKRSSFSCSEEEKHLIWNQQFLPKNLQFQPSNLSGFSPRLSTIESSPATALHSFGSRPCHRLRCSGTFRAHSGLWGPCAQGYLIAWVTGPFNCVVRFVLCPFVGLLVYACGPF